MRFIGYGQMRRSKEISAQFEIRGTICLPPPLPVQVVFIEEFTEQITFRANEYRIFLNLIQRANIDIKYILLLSPSVGLFILQGKWDVPELSTT